MIVLENTETIYCIENPKNDEYHYFCSKECAKSSHGDSAKGGKPDYCEKCGRELGKMWGDPLRTKCGFCSKEVIADSSCAGLEGDKIFYFCCQDHARQWGNKNRNGN